MGKTWKSRSHVRTGYPYRAPHLSQHVHVVRPRARKQGNGEPYFIGAPLALLTVCILPQGRALTCAVQACLQGAARKA